MDPVGPILVVVAHYDDEVIGAGAHLARWAERTMVVYATDGAPRDGADAREAGFPDCDSYAAARRREAGMALACLPRPIGTTIDLNFPDRGLTDRLTEVIDCLRQVVERARPSAVVTHAYEGGHPDHDALAFAVSALRGWPGLPRFDVVEFAEYHENADGVFVTNRFADAPADVALLTPSARRLKRLMLACFRTQARVLAPFGCHCEALRPAAVTDFSRPPASGRVWFDRRGWQITGDEWRACVTQVARRIPSRDAACSPF